MSLQQTGQWHWSWTSAFLLWRHPVKLRSGFSISCGTRTPPRCLTCPSQSLNWSLKGLMLSWSLIFFQVLLACSCFLLSARSSRRLRPHRDMGKPRVTTSDKNSGRSALRQANHAGSWLQSAMTLGQINLKQIYASSHPILWVDDPYYDMVCLQN